MQTSGFITTQQMAQRLGITPRAVRALAKRHGIGSLVTDRMYLFSEADAQRLTERVGKVGRPKPR